ncbi:MAG: glycoside hydrolase family 57 protein [Bacteroidales bacterium]|nr:glycoside hydrolase family 57 protein [Bacteroidales bacterium]
MRSICLYFQVHQPFRLRTYRFFEMGEDHYYYDDYQNRHQIQELAKKCYLPANQLMMDLIERHGDKFRVSFSISGTALELFERYAPEVIESFQKLVKTKNVEIVAEPYSHSLAGLHDKDEFVRQIKLHTDRMKQLFGVEPKTLGNTELLYSDDLGADVAELGFSAMLTEGAKHVMGWRSPNFLYCNAINPKLNVLVRNFPLSEDLELRFGDQQWEHWHLTAEKFTGWLKEIDEDQPVVNLFLPYEVLGEYQRAETGIFDFLRALPEQIFKDTDFVFNTPQQIVNQLQPTSEIDAPYPISWFDEERDITSWMSNEMQSEALTKLYQAAPLIEKCPDESVKEDWLRLQSADHFFYMSTKWFSGISNVRLQKNYYASPYEAFINYMNILSDLLIRVSHE